MHARELRIGNWVNGDRDWIGVNIDFQVNLIEDCDYGGLINPIPITENWLKRFGFTDPGKKISGLKEKGYLTIMLGLHTILVHNNGQWELNANVSGEAVPFPCPQLKYVHQLQNLYFALTGEELKLN